MNWQKAPQSSKSGSGQRNSGSQGDGINLEAVTKSFGEVVAVDSVTLAVAEGEFFSLLGPSGCGKTTLLRIVAGFEPPDSGRVVIHGRDVTASSPRKRPTAMVFQNYALFPTMTVSANVEYGLRVRRIPRAERKARMRKALERVGLQALEDRPVDQLSGGQQQRVAVARAIAVEPEVLLFDEPLSNLDVTLREKTRAELIEIQDRLGITSIYVTHDQEEALALSDRIGVMNHGRLLAVGTPRDLYEHPASAFVAGFLGGANLIADPKAVYSLTGEEDRQGEVLAVRPEHLVPASEDAGLRVTIDSSQYLGSSIEFAVSAGRTRLRLRLSPDIGVETFTALRASKWKWVDDDLDDQSSAKRLST
ncbi:MAG: ABC transporter ATP-binding protein [Rhodothermia bacterium]|nr:ABC transporter ATP-binding protein [Rhodothermia bacterium]